MTAAWIAGCALASIASASGAVAIASAWVPSHGERAPASAAAAPSPAPVVATAPSRPASPPLPPAAPAPAPVVATAPSRPGSTPVPPEVAVTTTAASTPSTPPPPCSHVVEIRFGYDDARPPRGAVDELAAVVELAHARSHAEIIVAGHADPTGAELPNLILSKQRAAGIARLLVAAGVPRERISERAYGSYAPRTGALAAQRRVTVDVREPDCRKEPP